MFYRSFLLLVIFFYFPVLAQDQSDDDSDFSQPNTNQQTEANPECALSKDSELIALLNFKLRKFNPTTPSQRNLVLVDKSSLYKGGPLKTLTEGLSKTDICQILY